MKIKLLFALWVAFLFLNPGMGNSSLFARNLPPLDSSLEEERPLVDILKELSEKYQVIFSYKTQLLEGIKVNYEINEEEELQVTINRLLDGTGLSYKFLGSKYYVIYKNDKQSKKHLRKLSRRIQQIQDLEEKGGLDLQQTGINKNRRISAIAKTAIYLKGTEQTINGTITDGEGSPLAGAAVRAEGTNQGAISDERGKFSLTIPDEVKTLVISYIGYQTQRIEIAGRTIIEIVLVEEISTLDEIVVVGYGTQKKVNVTSAVTSVDVEELGQITYPNIGAALQGRAPGLFIQDQGYQRGLSFLVRGQTTIGNNGPLIIVDGTPNSSFDINPLDIENISILKDGAAAAIYGARAAAGVILITTKSGSIQAPTITYDVHVGWGNVTTKPNILGSVESARIMNEAAINSGADPLFTDEQINNFTNGSDPENYADTYWPDQVLKTEIQQKHYLSVSGGNAKNKYLFSLGYRNDNGIFKEAVNRTTYTTRLNLGTEIRENLNLSVNLFLYPP